jgi:hypothetical protein
MGALKRRRYGWRADDLGGYVTVRSFALLRTAQDDKRSLYVGLNFLF